MRAPSRPSPFIQDVLLTGLTSLVTMGSLIVATGWLAAGLGPRSFGVYALSRRLVSVVGLFSVVVGVALTRSLAMAKEERDRLAYYSAAALFAVVPNLILVAAGIPLAGFWARVLFADAVHAPVLVATLALLVGSALYAVVFAGYRGTGRMRRANLWHLWALALGPALVAGTLADSGQVDLIVLATAAVMLPVVVPLGRELTRAATVGVGWSDVRKRLAELMRYGLPRVPGAFAVGGLLAIGPFLAPYFGDLRQAGFLVAGQSMMRVVEGGTSAFGVVALPRIAALHAAQRTGFIRERVEDIVAVAVHVGLFATCQLLLWSRAIVLAWLGPGYEEAVPLIRVMLLAVVPYLSYSLLRSVIDALHEEAVNAGNGFVACGVTAVLSVGFGLVGWGAFGLALAGSLGFVTLGLLSVRHLWRSLGLSAAHLSLVPALGLNAILVAFMAGARELLPSDQPWTAMLAIGIALEAMAFAIYLLGLRRAGARWLAEVEARLRPRGAASSAPPA
jgi:O-antigen/teichoic acid export membrane protein